jgi:hypothetical protein
VAAINRSIDVQESNIVKAIELLSKEYHNRLFETGYDREADVLLNGIRGTCI